MMYILWFATEGHFVLLKKQEIFPEQNDFTYFWWITQKKNKRVRDILRFLCE